MPTKTDYMQVIEDKLDAESGKKSEKEDGVSSTDQNTGRDPDVSIKDK